MQQRKKLIFILLYCLSPGLIMAQNQDSSKVKTRQLYSGISLPYYTLRDKTCSSLLYRGFGGLEVNLGYTRRNNYNDISQLSFTLGMAEVYPSIENKSSWNKAASVVNFFLGYSYLKGLNSLSNSNTHYFLGGSITSNAWYSEFPVKNNIISYNFNWLSAHINGQLMHNFTLGGKNIQLNYEASLLICSLNTRPKTYTGLIPAEIAWNQDQNVIRMITSDIKLTTMLKNIMYRSSISLDFHIAPKHLIKFAYLWHYTLNKAAIHRYENANSALQICYIFQFKPKFS